MKMTGAKMVVESLHQEGVEVVFGYPGGAIMNVYDEIYKQPNRKTCALLPSRAIEKMLGELNNE